MARLEKALQYSVLYLHAWWVSLRKGKANTPLGIRGEAVFMFFDPAFPERLHGVVAFALPPGTKIEQFSGDIWGPFGYSEDIDLNGLHLYGLDTWGQANFEQIKLNPVLAELAVRNPGCTFQLAGVRSLFGHHIPPTNDPKQYKLVWK